MYILFEYITFLALVFAVGASLFVSAALGLFVKGVLTGDIDAEWLGTTIHSLWARLPHGRHQVT